MLKKLLKASLVLSLAFSTTAFAQERKCHTMEALEQQKKADPGLAFRMAQIEAQTASYVKAKQLGTAGDMTSAVGVDEVATINVVVHVLYSNSSENISDAQVKSQIDVLNEDFRKLNADVSKTPSMFAGLASDIKLQFKLATTTPTGAATTGINRKSTTKTSWGTGDAMKKSSMGGIDPWDTKKYLNIWVAEIGGGILGYAQFPGGSASTDGVVIGPKYFGRGGSASAPFDRGRTATHEVGHYLNLRHIWGDANCGNDMVADTPTQQTSNGGCPSFPKPTCNNTSDMFMNYMDYTNDACMFMFSKGQKDRMRALFVAGGFREALVTAGGTGTTCATPSSLASSSVTSSSATLSWGAVSGASRYNLRYRVSGTTTWTNISSIYATSRSLTGLTAAKTYEFQVNAVCSTGSSAYSASKTFYTGSSTSTCAVPTSLRASSVTETTFTLNWGAVTGANSYGVRLRVLGSSTWSDFEATSNSLALTGAAANTTYEYQVNSVCTSGSSAYSAISSVKTSGGTTTPTYCASKGTDSSDEWIQSVRLGTINNTSGNNSGYGNFTNLSTTLVRGSSSTITITPGWAGSRYAEGYAVFIDLNRDGDFTDSGERVYYRSATTLTPVSGSFTVPTSALTGTTRMRVAMKYNGTPTACESFSYGEVEDYTVNISSSAKEAVTARVDVAAKELQTSVYPNPAEGGKATVKVAEAGQATVTDMLGRKVISSKLEEGENSLDLSKYGKGIYFITIQSGGTKTVEKLIVR